MRDRARLALAVVVLLGAIAALPRPASRFVAPDANAQVPTPTLPDLLNSPQPSPEPSEDPLPDPGGGGGGEEPGGGGGGGEEGGSGGDGDKGDDGGKDRNDDDGGRGDGRGDGRGGRKGGRGDETGDPKVPSIAGRIPGAYDTSKLVAVATQLRALGMPAEEVTRKVFPPFIIAGRASWIDTWHAPRYGPAPGQVRLHEGQDVFCDYGDPILAPTDGTVSFSDGGLGGVTARVHMANGEYWYMTHLSDFNRELTQGQAVTEGAIVGFCGNSGNAATTAPHVHFGWYEAGGVNPRNPMRPLIAWLREAERRVLGVVLKTNKERQRRYVSGELTTARRFGDAFAPDTSELRLAGESLWAAGTNPASGAFGLAEAALQEALSSNGLNLGLLPVPVDLMVPEETATTSLDPGSALAEVLENAHHMEASD